MPSGHKKKNSKASAVSPPQLRNETMGKENLHKTEGDVNRKKKHEAEGGGDRRSCGFFFYSGLAEEMDAFESKGNIAMGKENHFLAENKAEGNLSRKKVKEKLYIAEKEVGGDRNNKEGKKKSKQENKEFFASSPDHQSLLPSNMQNLKMSSFGNGAMGKENHYPAENKAEQNCNKKKGKEKNYLADRELEGDQNSNDGKKEAFFVPKTVETAAVEEMDDMKVLLIEKSCEELQKEALVDKAKATQNDEADSISPKNEIPHSPMVVRRASLWKCCGLLEVLVKGLLRLTWRTGHFIDSVPNS